MKIGPNDGGGLRAVSASNSPSPDDVGEVRMAFACVLLESVEWRAEAKRRVAASWDRNRAKERAEWSALSQDQRDGWAQIQAALPETRRKCPPMDLPTEAPEEFVPIHIGQILAADAERVARGYLMEIALEEERRAMAEAEAAGRYVGNVR